MMTPTLAFACDLISRRSVTPEDAGCLDVIAARLGAVGFHCERIDANGTSNLWATRTPNAAQPHPVFAFAGHTDVVPTGPLDKWTHDPFAPTIVDGML